MREGESRPQFGHCTLPVRSRLAFKIIDSSSNEVDTSAEVITRGTSWNAVPVVSVYERQKMHHISGFCIYNIKKFPGSDTPGPRKCPRCLDPDTNFHWGCQRSYCSCFCETRPLFTCRVCRVRYWWFSVLSSRARQSTASCGCCSSSRWSASGAPSTGRTPPAAACDRG